MGKKGLCETCLSDTKCIFQAKFPVLQCEEFSDYQPKAKGNNSNTAKRNKQRETSCINIETTESFD
ncbi:MAG: hypothetical protein PHC54_07460 [Candidatus Omnitrophica bacterium]|nr:hypothetical protein [Candidatus Omnitrophota bacterium]MDD5593031.1 hypothetical protein [Candidatus Omnitrophota bacterium]